MIHLSLTVHLFSELRSHGMFDNLIFSHIRTTLQFATIDSLAKYGLLKRNAEHVWIVG